jgi:serine protease inhibitor
MDTKSGYKLETTYSLEQLKEAKVALQDFSAEEVLMKAASEEMQNAFDYRSMKLAFEKGMKKLENNKKEETLVEEIASVLKAYEMEEDPFKEATLLMEYKRLKNYYQSFMKAIDLAFEKFEIKDEQSA